MICFFLCSFAAEVFIKCKQSAPGYFQLVGHHLLFVPFRCFIDHFNLGQKWSSVSVSIPSHHVDIGYTPKETKEFLFCHLILRQAKIRLGNMPMSVTLCCRYTLKIFAMASVSLAKWAGYLTQPAGGIVICYEIFRNMSGISYFSDWYFKPSFSNENYYVNIVDDVFRFLILEKKKTNKQNAHHDQLIDRRDTGKLFHKRLSVVQLTAVTQGRNPNSNVFSGAGRTDSGERSYRRQWTTFNCNPWMG